MANALRTDYIRDIGRAPGIAQQNILAKRHLQEQTTGLQQQNVLRQRELDRYQFRSGQEAIDYFLKVKDMITFENWPRFKEYSMARGVPEEALPEFSTPEEFETWKMTAAEKISAYKAETGRIKSEKGPKPTSLIEQYNFAKQQFKDGTGKNPGSFTQWKKSVAKAGATTISFSDKVALHEAKAETTAKISLRKEIQSPKLRSTILNDLKKQYGADWNYLEDFEKDEMLFREMDKRIKEAYPQQEIAFDESRGGWINKSTGKLVRKYEQVSRKKKGELFLKGGFTPRKREPSINILNQ